MLFLPTDRNHLLKFLPKGGKVVEIGVAEGDFSQVILQHTAPKRLHLIDPWVHQAQADYAEDPNNVSDQAHEDRFQGVKDRFAAEIKQGQVVLHRGFSQNAAHQFANHSLDWIYIDGLHTYEGVLSDLALFYPKVTASGFILGHDYTNHAMAHKMNFGVVKAVNGFIQVKKVGFVALTAESFPTYLLAIDPQSETARQLFFHLIHQIPGLVEIRNPFSPGFNHQVIDFGPDGQRVLASF